MIKAWYIFLRNVYLIPYILFLLNHQNKGNFIINLIIEKEEIWISDYIQILNKAKFSIVVKGFSFSSLDIKALFTSSLHVNTLMIKDCNFYIDDSFQLPKFGSSSIELISIDNVMLGEDNLEHFIFELTNSILHK